MGAFFAGPAASVTPMQVDRTFAFLDLCGFTAYTEAQGNGAAVAVLADFRSALREAGAEHGVRVTKWLGDGAMLSGVDPASVIVCSMVVRDHVADHGPLPLRGGIARGTVIMFEGDDYVGGAVNLAARLCRAADPNRILAQAEILRDVPVAMVTAPVDDMALAGVARAVAAVELQTATRGGARLQRAPRSSRRGVTWDVPAPCSSAASAI